MHKKVNYIHSGSFSSFDAATVKTNHTPNANTSGKIAVLNFDLKDSKYFIYKSQGNKIYAMLYGVKMIDKTGKELNINVLNDSAIVLGQSSGINKTSNRPDLKIYPNPAKDAFTIESTNAKIEKLSLFNSLGQCVLNISPSSQRFQIDVSSLPNGIYFISINDGVYSGDWKIVVQR